MKYPQILKEISQKLKIDAKDIKLMESPFGLDTVLLDHYYEGGFRQNLYIFHDKKLKHVDLERQHQHASYTEPRGGKSVSSLLESGKLKDTPFFILVSCKMGKIKQRYDRFAVSKKVEIYQAPNFAEIKAKWVQEKSEEWTAWIK